MIRVRIAWASKGTKANKSEVAIVTDILRASTVVTTLLAYGAEYVLPVTDVDEAIECAKKRKALLIGERNAIRIKGFDFGNSPTALSKDAISGKPVIFSSTNFPRACIAAKDASKVYIGCFLNIRCVVEHTYQYAHKNSLDICLVLAGSKDSPDEEDLAFAATSIDLLMDNKDVSLSDEVIKAIQWIHEVSMEKAVLNSERAKRLENLGFAEDIHFAIQKNVFPIIPFLNGLGIVRLSDICHNC